MKQRRVQMGGSVDGDQLQKQSMKSFDLWSITDMSKRFAEQGYKEHAKMIKAVPPQDDPGAVQRVMRSYLLLGQCNGIFPVYGVLSDHVDDLKFSWKSPRAVCSLVVLVAYASMGALHAIHSVLRGSLSFRTIDNIMGYALYVATLTLLLLQARKWPALLRHWHDVERRMAHFPPVRGLECTVKCYVITFFIGTLLLGASRVASNASTLYPRCTRDPLTLVHMTLITKFQSAVRVVGYSPPAVASLALLTFLVHQNTVMVYDELTVTVLPLCLAQRFLQLYRYMRRHDGRTMPITYWAEMRETYSRLSHLARQLEDHLTSLTLITIGSNLYFICSLLLSYLHKSNGPWTSACLAYLLAFTAGRTFAAALAAASLYEHSKRPLHLLFSVPTDSYSTEVARFQMQVAHDEITITGCNFFALTRSFILTVAGTIITYAIVLLQFGSGEDDTAETSSFKESTCTWLTHILNDSN